MPSSLYRGCLDNLASLESLFMGDFSQCDEALKTKPNLSMLT